MTELIQFARACERRPWLRNIWWACKLAAVHVCQEENRLAWQAEIHGGSAESDRLTELQEAFEEAHGKLVERCEKQEVSVPELSARQIYNLVTGNAKALRNTF